MAGDGRRSRSRINFLHALIRPHFIGRSGHQYFALVHHGYALRESEHAIDVMFDNQNRNIGGYIFHKIGYAFALGRGEPRERFVEQENLRFRTQGDA